MYSKRELAFEAHVVLKFIAREPRNHAGDHAENLPTPEIGRDP